MVYRVSPSTTLVTFPSTERGNAKEGTAKRRTATNEGKKRLRLPAIRRHPKGITAGIERWKNPDSGVIYPRTAHLHRSHEAGAVAQRVEDLKRQVAELKKAKR